MADQYIKISKIVKHFICFLINRVNLVNNQLIYFGGGKYLAWMEKLDTNTCKIGIVENNIQDKCKNFL